jgi:hypothetical protein
MNANTITTRILFDVSIRIIIMRPVLQTNLEIAILIAKCPYATTTNRNVAANLYEKGVKTKVMLTGTFG